MKTIKNYWLQILAILGIILELGFDVINPLLLELGVPQKWLGIIKVLFVIYALVKSKMQDPKPSNLNGSNVYKNRAIK